MNILILNIVFHNLNDIQSRDVKLEKEIGGRLEERGGCCAKRLEVDLKESGDVRFRRGQVSGEKLSRLTSKTS